MVKALWFTGGMRRQARFVLAAFAALSLSLVAACGSDTPEEDAPTAGKVAVKMLDNKFNPSTFEVAAGTRVTFDLPFGILRAHLDDFVLLSEEELAGGVRLALRTTHNLAEGAGAASLAAARKLAGSLGGKRVACVMSGGNIDARTLRRLLAAG